MSVRPVWSISGHTVWIIWDGVYDYIDDILGAVADMEEHGLTYSVSAAATTICQAPERHLREAISELVRPWEDIALES